MWVSKQLGHVDIEMVIKNYVAESPITQHNQGIILFINEKPIGAK